MEVIYYCVKLKICIYLLNYLQDEMEKVTLVAIVVEHLDFSF